MVTVTEIRPSRWSMSDAGNLIDVAGKLARLAVGEETDRSGVNVPVTEVTAEDMARAASEVEEWEQGAYGLQRSSSNSA